MKNIFKPLISVLSGEAGVRVANLCFTLLMRGGLAERRWEFTQRASR